MESFNLKELNINIEDFDFVFCSHGHYDHTGGFGILPIIDKPITVVSDINTIGQITEPQQGQVVVHLTEADTSFPTGEYSLIVSLEGENYIDIISSECCNKAIYKICEQ